MTLGKVGDAIAELPASMRAFAIHGPVPDILEQLVGQQALVIRVQHQGFNKDPAVRRKIKLHLGIP